MGRLHLLRGPLLTAAGTAGLTWALHVRDPHEPGSWGICPTRFLTGWDCPGCGGLRAVHDLTDGDLVSAASSNLLFVAAIPFLLTVWTLWLRRAASGEPWRPGPRTAAVTWATLAVTLGFAVLRNLPGLEWLRS